MQTDLAGQARTMHIGGRVILFLGWVAVGVSLFGFGWYVNEIRHLRDIPFGRALANLVGEGVLFMVPSVGIVLIGVVTQRAARFWSSQIRR